MLGLLDAEHECSLPFTDFGESLGLLICKTDTIMEKNEAGPFRLGGRGNILIILSLLWNPKPGIHPGLKATP
jgi:hypothetical protein